MLQFKFYRKSDLDHPAFVLQINPIAADTSFDDYWIIEAAKTMRCQLIVKENECQSFNWWEELP